METKKASIMKVNSTLSKTDPPGLSKFNRNHQHMIITENIRKEKLYETKNTKDYYTFNPHTCNLIQFSQ